MMPLRKIATVAVMMGLLAGCMHYAAIDPGKPREVGGVFRVDPGVMWSGIKSGRVEVWTINGQDLESISFLTAIKDDEPLLPVAGGKKKDTPTYRSGMRAPDVVDLFEATLISFDYSQIEARNLRPAEIGGTRGFRFEYDAFDGNGLAKRGIVLGLIGEEDGLNLIIYEAAAEHYYEHYVDEVEGMLNSIETI